MKLFFDDSPIVACSTSLNTNSAIAIVRLSGFEKLHELQPFFSTDLKKILPRTATLSKLLNKNRDEIDNVVITYFKGPKSYSGENLLEINTHGNKIIVKDVLRLFSEESFFRYAYQGEFTYRALKNKKLNLNQVEGLDLLLNANSRIEINQGLKSLNGELNREYIYLREDYVRLKAAVELFIDFSEDVGEKESKTYFKNAFQSLKEKTESLYRRTKIDDKNLTRPKIVIVGKPNAGKSSLFNLILNNDRSIVSEQSGTTRDYISETIEWSGVEFNLIDTAGLANETSDVIEVEGIGRAKNLIHQSLFIILVINPFDNKKIDDETLKNSDLVIFSYKDRENFEKNIFNPGNKQILNANLKNIQESQEISHKALDMAKNKYNTIVDKNPLLIERHKALISNIWLLILDLDKILDHEQDVAILSSMINYIGQFVEELIGIIPSKEVEDKVFKNFCIGK